VRVRLRAVVLRVLLPVVRVWFYGGAPGARHARRVLRGQMLRRLLLPLVARWCVRPRAPFKCPAAVSGAAVTAAVEHQAVPGRELARPLTRAPPGGSVELHPSCSAQLPPACLCRDECESLASFRLR